MPLGLASSFHAGSVPFRDGFVLVGGSSERGRVYHDTLHYFEPEDERWEEMSAKLDHARGFHIASEGKDSVSCQFRGEFFVPVPVTKSMGICR